MYDFAVHNLSGLLRNPQGKQGTAGAGAHDQQIVFRNGRLGNLAHIVGFDAQVGQPLTHALQRQHHPPHAYKKHLIRRQDLIHQPLQGGCVNTGHSLLQFRQHILAGFFIIFFKCHRFSLLYRLCPD